MIKIQLKEFQTICRFLSQEFCRNISTATYGYDELDRLTSVLDPENKLMEIHYGYRDGQLKSMTDPRNNTSQYTYSTAGHLEKFINPLDEVKEYKQYKTRWQYRSKVYLSI